MKQFRDRVPMLNHCNPLAQQFFELRKLERVSYEDLAKRSGVAMGTMWSWRTRFNPLVPIFAAALNAMGYELVIRRRREDE
jgi:transcriptional regulator with XRE-family HTH domain